MEQHARAYRDVGLPVLGANCFSTPELADKFNKRLRLLAATFSVDGPHFRRPRDIARAPSQRKIYLPDFAAWAASVAVFDELPPPLIALARSVAQASAALAIASARPDRRARAKRRQSRAKVNRRADSTLRRFATPIPKIFQVID